MNESFIWEGAGWYASRATWTDERESIVITEKFAGSDATSEEAEAEARAAGYGTPVYYETAP